MEALGSITGVRSRAITRTRVAQTSTPRKNVARRFPSSTKRSTNKKLPPPAPTLAQQVQSLAQQINTLQATIGTLQQTVTALNTRVVKIEGGIHVANNGNVTIGQSGKVTVQGSEMEVNTSLVDVNAGVSNFSGFITASSITTDSIASKSYTPGAGNIW